ncbi:hypothetical protein [Candidatus Chlamydia corallus]|nr:hypothetical protein [Candidatus Chlamydia corallus]
MKIYSFSPGTCPNWQTALMSKLDSYCCLGGGNRYPNYQYKSLWTYYS